MNRRGTEPYARWCERTGEATPPPTRFISYLTKRLVWWKINSANTTNRVEKNTMSETGIRRTDARGLMLLHPERVCYLGLLGGPSARVFGAHTLYWAPDWPFRLSCDARRWRTCHVAWVPPYQPHRIAADGRLLGAVLLEPEHLAVNALCALKAEGETLTARLREGFDVLQARVGDGAGLPDVERLLFGARLRRRRLDARIERVFAQVFREPGCHHDASDCAGLAGLSSSRFLHLLKQETGIPFRRLCAWKRARGLLYQVSRRASLTHIALDIGYPDATHFSHSIRRTYGLTPRDIVAGSRRLAIRREHECHQGVECGASEWQVPIPETLKCG